MAAAKETDFTRVLGTADAFALLAAAFAYPDERLAGALSDGSYLSDARGVLADMGVGAEASKEALDRLAVAVEGREAEALLSEMRADYTTMFYAPGKHRKIFPYESAFRKTELDPSGKVTLFLSKSTHDVERAMSKRGALPEDYRREPADFVATELDFMRHLLTGCAAELAEGTGGSSWAEDAARFLDAHVLSWIPSLLERTGQLAESDAYRALSGFGQLVLAHAEGCLRG